MVSRAHRNHAMTGWALAAIAAAILLAPGGAPALAQGSEPHVEVYGFVQADYIQDFKRVDPAWVDTLRPSKIPTTDGFFGDDGQASISAKQSRLGVMMNFPTSNKPVFTKFEFDMFGVGVDAGQTTIRLRHAYGQWGPFLAGQTNTLFMDASIFPNVIDYWGPNGMVFVRTPQIRWIPIAKEKATLSFAVERPSNDIDIGLLRELDPNLPPGIQGSQEIPDFTAQYRMQQGWGHLQVAGILRRVAFDTANSPDNEPKGHDTGWGVDVTTGIKFGAKDKLLGGVVYGEGIATYMNDGGVDLAPGGTVANPEAEAVPLLGVSAYYDHYWSDKFSSSFGYSFVDVDNTTFQAGDAFDKAEYASGNLLYYPTRNVMIGGEALWGTRRDNDGDDGDDVRVQISFHYSFSTKDIFKKNVYEQGQ
jgi:outer membrane DcaP-like protein